MIWQFPLYVGLSWPTGRCITLYRISSHFSPPKISTTQLASFPPRMDAAVACDLTESDQCVASCCDRCPALLVDGRIQQACFVCGLVTAVVKFSRHRDHVTTVDSALRDSVAVFKARDMSRLGTLHRPIPHANHTLRHVTWPCLYSSPSHDGYWLVDMHRLITAGNLRLVSVSVVSFSLTAKHVWLLIILILLKQTQH